MSNELIVGSLNTQSTIEPWPPYWQYTWPTYLQSADNYEEYANEVEVEQNEHDATLRFYRKKGKSKSLIKTITIPISILNWLQGNHE